MKRVLVLIFAICSFAVLAQQGVNNLDFEDFTNTAGVDMPNGFVSFNNTINNTTQKEGNSALHLETATGVLGLRQGMAIIGKTSGITGIDKGEAFIGGKPAKFEGFLKYDIPSTDTGLVVVEFTRWTGNETKIVGTVTQFIQGTQTEWECQDYDIYWDVTDSNNPDTVTVLFASSGSITEIPGFDYGANTVGSEMDVDDWCFDCGACATATQEKTGVKDISIYPQPAIEKISFVIPTRYTSISIFDIDGKLVKQLPYRGKSFEISTDDFDSGVYFYEVKNREQNVHSGKLSVVRL